MRVCKHGSDFLDSHVLSVENYLIKGIEHFFYVCIGSSKHSVPARIPESYANPRLRLAQRLLVPTYLILTYILEF